MLTLRTLCSSSLSVRRRKKKGVFSTSCYTMKHTVAQRSFKTAPAQRQESHDNSTSEATPVTLNNTE